MQRSRNIANHGLLLLGLLASGCALSSTAEVSVLTVGAPLHSANGIRFDEAGRLHVASVFGREIVVMDPSDGTILDRYTVDDGVETPDDLAFGPDGSLYWTAIATGAVGRRSSDGVFSTVAQLPPGVNPIGFSADGRLFVGSCYLGTGLYEVDPQGAEAPRLIRDFPGEPCGVNAFDIGPEGLIHAPRVFSPELVSIDTESGETRATVGGFGAPVAVKFDPEGRLLVLDSVSRELVRVNLGSGKRQRVASVPNNVDNLAFAPDGRLFISVNGDGSVHEVNADGSLREVSRGGLTLPGGLALLGDHLFVADHVALVELSSASGEELSRQASLPGLSELAEPLTVSAMGTQLVTSSWRTNAVQIWDPTEQRLVADHRDFDVPLNAIAFDGGLAVAQLGSQNVVLERAGVRTPLLGGVAVPTGLAARQKELFVADWALGTITAVAESREPRVVARGLSNPEGLAFNSQGRLLVVEAGAARVTEIDPECGPRRIVAEELAIGLPGVPGFPPSYAFSGITVDAAGNAYATGDVENLVYFIPRRLASARPRSVLPELGVAAGPFDCTPL